MKQTIKIALAQMNITWLGFQENLKKIAEYVNEAETQNADWIVFPEMALTGFCMEPEKVCLPQTSESFQNLLRITRGKKVVVMIGLAQNTKGEFTNDFLIIQNGEILCAYSKIHLFTMQDEHKYYQPGYKLKQVELDGIKVTPFICFDTRFSDMFSKMAGQGTDVFVVIASWPKEQAAQWKTLLSARAIDTQSFVVGVNRVGEGDGLCFNGDSNVFSPGGKPIAEFTSEQKLIFVEIDPSKVKKLRSQYPVLFNQHTEKIKVSNSPLRIEMIP